MVVQWLALSPPNKQVVGSILGSSCVEFACVCVDSLWVLWPCHAGQVGSKLSVAQHWQLVRGVPCLHFMTAGLVSSGSRE